MEQFQCSKTWRVHISKNTMTDKAVLEVRVDASAGRGMAVRRGAGRIRHIATPALWVHQLTQDGMVKITKIPGISNLADLGTKHLDGGSIRRALKVIATFVKEGLESRCEQKCEKSQNLILKFSLLTIHVKLTRSRKRKWSRNSIYHESSDVVKLKQLRDQMV